MGRDREEGQRRRLRHRRPHLALGAGRMWSRQERALPPVPCLPLPWFIRLLSKVKGDQCGKAGSWRFSQPLHEKKPRI